MAVGVSGRNWWFYSLCHPTTNTAVFRKMGRMIQADDFIPHSSILKVNFREIHQQSRNVNTSPFLGQPHNPFFTKYWNQYSSATSQPMTKNIYLTNSYMPSNLSKYSFSFLPKRWFVFEAMSLHCKNTGRRITWPFKWIFAWTLPQVQDH